ncbi:MAG: hypothetical protein ACM37W_07700 [Actinomycetota bacterium]
MRPKITNMIAWQQAELLMQPAMIRVIDNIRKQLEQSAWTGTYQEVQTPVPGYQLCLKYQNYELCFDIWELCYQICFTNYLPSHSQTESTEVEIDTSLIEASTGDVDWNRLDEKARQVVEAIFATLPLEKRLQD